MFIERTLMLKDLIDATMLSEFGIIPNSLYNRKANRKYAISRKTFDIELKPTPT